MIFLWFNSENKAKLLLVLINMECYDDYYNTLRRLFDPADSSVTFRYNIFDPFDEKVRVDGSIHIPFIHGSLNRLGHNLGIIAYGLGCRLVFPSVHAVADKCKNKYEFESTYPWTEPIPENKRRDISPPETEDDIRMAFNYFISQYEKRPECEFKGSLLCLPPIESPFGYFSSYLWPN